MDDAIDRADGAHFFISRAGPDRDYAVKIAHILETAGYRVFIQDRDIRQESIMAAMHGALSSGARTIALLSTDYLDPRRPHCAAEWQATIADDPLNTKRRLILLKVGHCAPTGLLKSLAYLDLAAVRDDALLADIVLGAVSPDAGTSLPEAVARYWREAQPITHHEIRETANFTGRGEAIADIDSALATGETAAITQSRVAVHGMGGIGKSTLARQYAYETSEAGLFAGVWWLNAARDATSGAFPGVEGALLELRDTLYPGSEPPRERAAAARGMLDFIANGGFAKPWLLVYDNVDDLAVLRDWKPPRNAHALITTRLTTFRKGEVTPIAIEVWALPEATAYLLRDSGRDDIQPGEAEAIAEALGRLPLALSHAAAYLREVPTATPQSYLAAIERRMRAAPPGMADAKPVYATFQEAIAQAEAQAAGASHVMTFAALLAPDNIPLELFAQDATLYPAELAHVLADPDGLEQATGALARLSLIEVDREAQTISVHRLVQAAARDALGAEASRWFSAAFQVANAAFPFVEFGNWPFCERLLPHAQAVASAAQDEPSEALGRLLNQTGFYLQERAAYDLAEPLYKRTVTIFETALGPDHPSVGTSLNNLAALYEAQGKYDLAEPLTKRSLHISETALGPDHPDVGHSLNNLALLYLAQGQYDLAEPLTRRALHIRETALGPDHPSVGTSLNNLAGLYEAQGKYDLAEPLTKRSLQIRETALGPDHPDVGITLWNMADLFVKTARLDEAAPLARRAHAIFLRALGPDHPHSKGAAGHVAAIEDAIAKRV